MNARIMNAPRARTIGCALALGTIVAAVAAAAPPGTTDHGTPKPPHDPQRVVEAMRQGGTTLAKAIEAAERQLKGQAIDARARATGNGNPVMVDVTVVDASGVVSVATVDVSTGKVASTRVGSIGDGDMAMHGEILKASSMKGRDILNASNKKIGDIEELAIDEARGRIAYAIVDLDGTVDRDIVVPWAALRHEAAGCRIDVQGARGLEGAPVYTANAWPTMVNEEYGRPISEYYGVPAYGSDKSLPQGTAFTMIKLSDVVGMDIKSPTGDNLGEIEDLVLNPENGEIAYAALSFGGFLGFNDKLFAVPWDALAARKDGSVILSVDKDRLKETPGFDKSHWPSSANPNFDAEGRRFYKRQTAGANE